jgi:hypothetical protein
MGSEDEHGWIGTPEEMLDALLNRPAPLSPTARSAAGERSVETDLTYGSHVIPGSSPRYRSPRERTSLSEVIVDSSVRTTMKTDAIADS